MTSAAPLAAARSCTHAIIGRPPMSASGLPGSRLDAYRAGITTLKSSCISALDIVVRRAPPRCGSAPLRLIGVPPGMRPLRKLDRGDERAPFRGADDGLLCDAPRVLRGRTAQLDGILPRRQHGQGRVAR